MEIRVSPHFQRLLRKLPKDIQNLVLEKFVAFGEDPFAPNLHTHKLQGGLQDRWAISITRDIRAIFYFTSEIRVVFSDIGSHDDVY